MTEFQGRRLPVGKNGALLDWEWEPGDYSGPYPPDEITGVSAVFAKPLDGLEHELVAITSPPHEFLENDDGTLSIEPILSHGKWLL